MTSPRAAALLTACALALVGQTSCSRRPAVAEPEAPRLAVLVYVDQLRGDLPERWMPLFDKGGFRRLATEGAWFQACYYPYANTLTGPGHATCATGCSPDVHGIVANEWYSAARGKEVNCVASERFVMVPTPADGKPGKGAAPDQLFAPTLGDALKLATDGKGKVVALTIKDRSAVLPAGKSEPDAVYWADKDGRFVTSTYYRDAVHPWVKQFNDSGSADRWLDRPWHRLRDDVDYVKWAGPDDVASEADVYGLGRTFPHPLGFGKKKTKAQGKRNYYEALASSPMGNEWLLELVERAIDAEELGQRDVPDFLSVSFSSSDLVGHAFGPDSQEALDAALRIDVLLRRLMEYLDEKVGGGKWVLALTADHGVCPLPEVAKKEHKDAKRFPIDPVRTRAEAFLDKTFCHWTDDSFLSGNWISHAGSNMFWLNRGRAAAEEVKVEVVAQALAAWIEGQPGFMAGYDRARIEGKSKEEDPILTRVRRSYHPLVSGDVTFVLKPYHLLNWDKGGTSHGTPHQYDRHVPLMVIGPGVKAGVRKDQRVSPEHAAVILARGLGIAPPAKAVVRVPEKLFE